MKVSTKMPAIKAAFLAFLIMTGLSLGQSACER